MKNELIIMFKLLKMIFLNSLYVGKYWIFRKKVKDEYKKIVEKELDSYDYYSVEGCFICIRYNVCYDVDNNVFVLKFVVDIFVVNGWIFDDFFKYYNKFIIVFDLEVEKNYCEVEVRLRG